MNKKFYLLYIFATLVFIGLVAQKYDKNFRLTELAGFGDARDGNRSSLLAGVPYYSKPNSSGYDGQFYAQIAQDPSLREESLGNAIDNPSYRARRILLPSLAYAIGLGDPTIALHAYCAINIISWFLFGILLLHWIPPHSIKNFAKWIACMFSMGALESVRYSLTDLPSIVMILGVFYFLEKNCFKSSGFIQVLSVFSKETNILNLFSTIKRDSETGFKFDRSRFLWATVCGLLSIALFAAWMHYIDGIFLTSVNAKGNIGFPFVGLYQAIVSSLSEVFSGNLATRYSFRLLAIAGLIYQIYYLVTKPKIDSPIWRCGITFTILFVVLGEFVWSGYWAASRIALPITVAFNILYESPSKKRFYLILFGSNIVMLHGLIRWF